jgi:hypothetical protein
MAMNQYPGMCQRCGQTVPAGQGTLARKNGNWLVSHSGDCPEITSGLGIGGHGSDDYSMATEGERPAPQFSTRKSSGQLWEPCARRGCDNEPSCLDCGYCLDTHCHCGGH